MVAMILDPRQQSGFLLLFCALALYLSSRVLLGLLVAGGDTPARRAVAQWLPIVMTAFVSILLGQPGAAVGVIFATSVGGLSLVLGVIALYRSEDRQTSTRLKFGLFLAPVCVMTWLAGFRTHLSWQHALLFILQGIALIWVWRQPASEPLTPAPARPRRKLSSLEWPLAIALAGLGAWAGWRGSDSWVGGGRGVSSTLLAATFLSPVLLLPIIGSSPTLALQGRSRDAILQQVLVVLLNLLILFPMTIFAWEARTRWIGDSTDATVNTAVAPVSGPATTRSIVLPEPLPDPPRGLPYPASVWRVDAILLILLAVAIIPIVTERWRLGIPEAVLLITVYCAYVALTAMRAIGI